MKFTPENITSLEPNQIFIYGSNSAGIHGAGAAKVALKFGAKYGKVGLVGQSYGLNTKDDNIETLPLIEIKKEVEKLLEAVKNNPNKEFLLTRVGTGLAGYETEDIAELFIDFMPLPSNLVMPKDFYDFWRERRGLIFN